MSPREIVATARTPDTQTVVLYRDRWDHVLDEHAEMALFLDDVSETIAQPDFRSPNRRVGRERSYRACGPQAWLRVVVALGDGIDVVVTAFPQDNDPRPRRRRP